MDILSWSDASNSHIQTRRGQCGAFVREQLRPDSQIQFNDTFLSAPHTTEDPAPASVPPETMSSITPAHMQVNYIWVCK